MRDELGISLYLSIDLKKKQHNIILPLNSKSYTLKANWKKMKMTLGACKSSEILTHIQNFMNVYRNQNSPIYCYRDKVTAMGIPQQIVLAFE